MASIVMEEVVDVVIATFDMVLVTFLRLVAVIDRLCLVILAYY
jgi:hypothetical protein